MLSKSLLSRRIEMIMHDRKSVRRLASSFIGTFTLVLTVAVAYGAEQLSRNQINSGTAHTDPAIQKIADKALAEAIQKEGAEAGFAIVGDPNTGAILAIANIDTKHRLSGHWALSQQNEPASLMKGITTAEAIELGVTTPSEDLNCEKGSYHFGERTFHDWKKGGWETLSTTDTVANSSDICAMKIAEKVGAKNIYQMLSNFGFGTKGSARNFPEAMTGTLPQEDNRTYSNLIPEAAYGMDFKATPIEVMQAFGAIANGGNLLAPSEANSKNTQAQIVRRVMSPETSEKMRTILQQVFVKGTAQNAPSKLYTMAGKTESSFASGVLEGDSTGGSEKTDTAGFVGFAPVIHPKIEVYVQIFRPKDPSGAHGSHHAAPVFTAIVDEVLQYMNVTPDRKL
jgi:cell division protein FtsI (penicillin-binding protein 3)